MSEQTDSHAKQVEPSIGNRSERDAEISDGAATLTSLRPFAWRELNQSEDAVPISVRLGSTHVPLERLASIRPGEIVELDSGVDDPVEILAGRDVLGYGRLVVVDGMLAVQVVELRQQLRRRSA